MRIILEPKATVVGQSIFKEHPEYKIPDDGDDFIKLGAFSAKGCYDSFSATGRPNEENQLAILEHRHGSVMEHSTVSLFIEGVTRGLSLELNRHRTFSISQRSTRYTAEEDSSIVLEPYFASLYKKYQEVGAIQFQPLLGGYNSALHGSLELDTLIGHLNSQYQSILQYQEQVKQLMKLNPNDLAGFDLRKWARGKARNVLPHGIETRGVWTNNVRGWRWFVELRSERHAEPEIRALADKVLEALSSVSPVYFRDFETTEAPDEIPEWKPLFSKV